MVVRGKRRYCVSPHHSLQQILNKDDVDGLSSSSDDKCLHNIIRQQSRTSVSRRDCRSLAEKQKDVTGSTKSCQQQSRSVCRSKYSVPACRKISCRTELLKAE
jgi:hypothetical protein